MDPKAIKLLIAINVFIWVGALVAFIVLNRINKLKASGKYNAVRKQKLHNKYLKYRSNVFLRARFRHVEKIFVQLSCFDRDKIEESSVEAFESALCMSILLPVLSGLLMRDILIFLLATIVGYIYFDITINRAADKVNSSIHKELAVCVQSIRDRMKECGDIPKSLLNCERGILLDKAVTEIYEILMANDGEDKLNEFCHNNPIRLLKALATCCFIVNETGDTNDDTGESAFAEDLIIIRQEVDAEIRRLNNIRIAFKSLPIIALLGLFIMPLEEWFLLSKIPGTSKLLKGTYGIIVKTIVMLSTSVAYYGISVMMRHTVVNSSDRSQFIDKLLSHNRFRVLVQGILPKKQIRIDSMMRKINGSLSQKDMYSVYASKLVYSSVVFVFTLLFTVIFLIVTKDFMYTNYKSLKFLASPPVKAEIHQLIVNMDEEYLKFDEQLNDEELFIFCKSRLRGMEEFDIINQRDRLKEKYTIYHNLSWKWWWGLVPIIASCIVWFAPEVVLLFRKSLVEQEAVEDVMQLQTMAIILSATDVDALKGLYWMERQSSIHKEALRYCYHAYTSDPEAALDDLKRKTDNVEFIKIINKFKSASIKTSLSDAFSDMKLDKAQYMYMRESIQQENLESKKQNAKLIAVVPGAVALVGYFVAPIIILGISQLYGSLGALDKM